jgi:hypothetical protein
MFDLFFGKFDLGSGLKDEPGLGELSLSTQ